MLPAPPTANPICRASGRLKQRPRTIFKLTLPSLGIPPDWESWWAARSLTRPEAAGQKEAISRIAPLRIRIRQCFLPGVPRANYMPFPFQIFQTAKDVAILYEYVHAYRLIPLNGSKHPEDMDFWMGDSRGHWEGDTLVVDVADNNDQTWFDASGNFHSGALHVVERYTRTGPDTIGYEATIEDPKVFTGPGRSPVDLSAARRRISNSWSTIVMRTRNQACDSSCCSRSPAAYGTNARAAAGLRKAGPMPRDPDGKPDFQGVWEVRPPGGTARLRRGRSLKAVYGIPPGKGVIVDPKDGKIPYLPAAVQRKKDLVAHHMYEDPEAHCFLSGIPRQVYAPFGFQILQPSNTS